MSLATASNWLWNFLLAFFTPFITSAIDFRLGYVFAGCLFLAAGLVYVAVIEGKGRTLEEIDTMYVIKVKPWKSSKFVFPDQDLGVLDQNRGQGQAGVHTRTESGRGESWEKEEEGGAARAAHVGDLRV